MQPQSLRRTVAAAVAAVVLLAAARASAAGLSIQLREHTVRQGDLLAVSISAPADASSISVSLFDRQWPAYRVDPLTWRAIVGVDLDQHPGNYVVHAGSSGDTAENQTVTVVRRQFTRRVLQVAPQFVNPPPDEMERIGREATLLSELYAHSGGTPLFLSGFERPVPGRANSSFGSRSVFNGQSRSPHAGTDFLSGTGTPVHAPAGGHVVAARDLFFTGNTVVIDHGLGVVSLLAHLSRIDVEEGQTVEAGDVVGLVGATGRVTGPHLHWALRVGAARVDPLSALRLLAPAGAAPPPSASKPQ